MYLIKTKTPNNWYPIHKDLTYSQAAYILADIKKNIGRGKSYYIDRKKTLVSNETGDRVEYQIIKQD